MKKLIFACCSLTMLLFSSCKECIDCNIEYTDPYTKEKLVRDYPEFCGSSKDIEKRRQMLASDALNYSEGEVVCIEE